MLLVMVVLMMMMVVVVRLLLNLPPKMKEVVDRARQPEWTGCVVAVNLMSFLQKPPEKGMVEKGNWDCETLKSAIFIL